MPQTAQQQLDGFLAKYDPAIEKLARDVMKRLHKRLPGSTSLIYDNYNALAIGFGPTEKEPPISIALYPRWVNLFFLQGAGLPDPHRLMQGKGARVRSIRIDKASLIDDERVDELITAAVLSYGWKLDPKAKTKLVVRSISPNQRPRRS
ncbi:MAG TPA: hypothetical protein VG942_12405 [Hyphomonadaceae bacterium]|nr:hypothetical protein [Hyphomonadaceae bacterium]